MKKTVAVLLMCCFLASILVMPVSAAPPGYKVVKTLGKNMYFGIYVCKEDCLNKLKKQAVFVEIKDPKEMAKNKMVLGNAVSEVESFLYKIKYTSLYPNSLRGHLQSAAKEKQKWLRVSDYKKVR